MRSGNWFVTCSATLYANGDSSIGLGLTNAAVSTSVAGLGSLSPDDLTASFNICRICVALAGRSRRSTFITFWNTSETFKEIYGFVVWAGIRRSACPDQIARARVGESAGNVFVIN